MQDVEKGCRIMQGGCRSMQKHAEACRSMQKHAEACRSMQKHVEACKGFQEVFKAFSRGFQGVFKRFSRGYLEVFRIFQEVARRCRSACKVEFLFVQRYRVNPAQTAAKGQLGR